MRTISIARTTPAQNPRGFKSNKVLASLVDTMSSLLSSDLVLKGTLFPEKVNSRLPDGTCLVNVSCRKGGNYRRDEVLGGCMKWESFEPNLREAPVTPMSVDPCPSLFVSRPQSPGRRSYRSLCVGFDHLLGVLEGAFGDLGTAQHARDFFCALIAGDVADGGFRTAGGFFLLNAVVVIGEGRDLRKLGDAEDLAGA